jgi:hypothetical protein
MSAGVHRFWILLIIPSIGIGLCVYILVFYKNIRWFRGSVVPWFRGSVVPLHFITSGVIMVVLSVESSGQVKPLP